MGKAILIALGLLVSALIVSVVGFLMWQASLNRELREWDARMDTLCAANGGADVALHVYETALAPETREYFLNPPNSFFIPERAAGKNLGQRYPYVRETRVVQVLNDKDPSVVKYTERIVRVGDNKILAERFGYQRAGGGIPGFDPGEIRVCPKTTTEERLDVQVFVNHPRHVPRTPK